MLVKNSKFYLFGLGLYAYSCIDRLDKHIAISGFIDSDKKKWGTEPFGDGRICISPEEAREIDNIEVVITVSKQSFRDEIIKECKLWGVKYCFAEDLLNDFSDENYICEWPEKIQSRRIHRFIDIGLRKTTTCNFHCEYCYVWRRDGYKNCTETTKYSIEEIRRAFSIERCGGVAFVNICASGETMLSKDIVELVKVLLEEGHFVSIVNNGTIANKIDEILKLKTELLERLFFKFSYHYFELEKAKLSKTFWSNVDKVKNSPCSYTIEITPCDRLIPYIEKIKRIFEDEADGAMPHISYARDSTKENLDILSEKTLEEYEKIWGTFDSCMFELKNKLYGKKITEYCYAGDWSLLINLETGNSRACYKQGELFPYVERAQETIPFCNIGNKCCLPYCFNNHAFIAWGCVPTIKSPTYLEMRDRIDKHGNHWVKPVVARFMSQKLYDNNYDYRGKWPDYVDLFEQGRKPAYLLFNSPDYRNVGDHAIAIGERLFINKFFDGKKLIEISREEYIKENLKIKNAIKEDDIIFICGGGNIGTLYLPMDDIVRHIITTYKDNKIIILPQTVYYADNNFGQAEILSMRKIMDAHKHVMITARENITYRFLEKNFGDVVKVEYSPDMAFMIEGGESHNKKNVLFCFRDDMEKVNNWTDLLGGLEEKEDNIEYLDMIYDDEVNLINRQEVVLSYIERIKNAKLVFTDRLHCMILCAITGTACIAFDNLSGKLGAVYETYLEEVGNIILHKSKSNIKDEINLIYNKNCNYEKLNDIRNELSNYSEQIKFFIGE